MKMKKEESWFGRGLGAVGCYSSVGGGWFRSGSGEGRSDLSVADRGCINICLGKRIGESTLRLIENILRSNDS